MSRRFALLAAALARIMMNDDGQIILHTTNVMLILMFDNKMLLLLLADPLMCKSLTGLQFAACFFLLLSAISLLFEITIKIMVKVECAGATKIPSPKSRQKLNGQGFLKKKRNESMEEEGIDV